MVYLGQKSLPQHPSSPSRPTAHPFRSKPPAPSLVMLLAESTNQNDGAQVLMLYFQLTVRYSKMLADGPAHLVPKVSPVDNDHDDHHDPLRLDLPGRQFPVSAVLVTSFGQHEESIAPSRGQPNHTGKPTPSCREAYQGRVMCDV